MTTGTLAQAGAPSTEVRLPYQSLSSSDVDEARELAGELYYPHQVSVVGKPADFSMHIDALDLGVLTVGWIRYDTEVEVTTGPLQDAYQVNIPSGGALITSSGPEKVVATPDLAAVYRWDRTTFMHGWREGRGRILALKIPRLALEERLEVLLDDWVRGPVQFEATMDLTTPQAQQWRSLLGATVDQLNFPDALCRHPLMSESLTQSIITGFLLASDHDYSALLHGHAQPARPATVQRAVDYIEEHLHESVDVAQIAAHVRVSVRSLQEGFQSALNTTPTKYLRAARLRQVRADLFAADPARTGVAELAHRWGFGHLGRFAAQYHDAFGEYPSTTLHRCAE